MTHFNFHFDHNDHRDHFDHCNHCDYPTHDNGLRNRIE